jgi:peptidoglycan/LPS O-acetylase OafA/YrhL
MLGHAVPLTNAPAPLQSLLHHGEAAVDLFFALSGLVIAFSLERFGGRFRPFIMARARRLLPVYLLVLAASILITSAGDPLAALPWAGEAAREIVPAAPPHPLWPHILAHLSLLHGLIARPLLPYAEITLLGPAWSLSTEWQFYLLIGLIAPRRLGRFALAVLAFGALWHALPWQALFSRAFFPAAAPYFAVGLASAAWLQGRSLALPLCILGACAIGFAASPDKALPPLIWGGIMLAQTARWGAVLELPVLSYLGAISYPLYLVNEPVQRLLALLLGPAAYGDATLFSIAFLPASLALSLGLAALLHHFVETPVMRRGTKMSFAVIAPPQSG